MSHRERAVQAQEPALRELVRIIVAEVAPVAVWLFGSRAEGRARPDSDYDLLVVVPDGAPSESFDLMRLWDLGRRAGLPADVIPCTASDFDEEKLEIDTLPRAAFVKGQLLYER